MKVLVAMVLVVAACGANPNPQTVVDSGGGEPGDDAVVAGDDAMVATGVDPAEPGPAVVTTANANIPGASQGRTLPSTIYVPDTPGMRPLVIVSPGFQMARTQYASYARHLATWGFVAILTDYADTGFFADHADLAADIPEVVDYALGRTDLAIDPTKIATVGHSLGGKLSVFAASLDPRIGAVVGFDPVDSSNPSVVPERIGQLAIPIAVVGETTNATGGGMPCAPAAENFQKFYAAASGTALAVTVANADHMDWVDDPSCGFCGFCTAGSASNEVARTVSRRVAVAWLRKHLAGDATMDAWIATPPELATGAIAIEQR